MDCKVYLKSFCTRLQESIVVWIKMITMKVIKSGQNQYILGKQLTRLADGQRYDGKGKTQVISWGFWSEQLLNNYYAVEAQRRNGFGVGEPRVLFYLQRIEGNNRNTNLKSGIRFNRERYCATREQFGLFRKGDVNSVYVLKEPGNKLVLTILLVRLERN